MSDLRTALAAIEEKLGHLTPEAVVEESRPKGHPLHDRIWKKTDKEAAYAHRIDLADKLIRSIYVNFVEGIPDEMRVRQYQATRRDGTYHSIEKIKEDPVLRDVLLRQAEREWRTMLARYKHMEEFLTMVLADVA